MFEENDLKNYAALAKIIEKGCFDLQGAAVVQTALLFKWYSELGPKMKAIIDKEQVAKETIKTEPMTKKKGSK